MTSPADPAFPFIPPRSNFAKTGLTKRELMATILHAGLLADHKDHEEEVKPGETCALATARIALEHTDALITLLNQNP